MLKRTITAIVAGVLLLVPAIIYSDTYYLNVFIALASLLATFEILQCTHLLGNLPICISCFIYSLVVPLFLAESLKNTYFATLVFFFVIAAIALLNIEKYKTLKLAMAFFVTFYTVNAFSTIIVIRRGHLGNYIWYLVFLGAWICDIFAYFSGYFFGKRKLIPSVSPKKTVAGAIGGILGNIIAYIIFGVIINNTTNVTFNIGILVLVGLGAGILSQIGDLLASAIKRNFNLKDFGKIFPGHGGLLDRCDSLLIIAPYILIVYSGVLQI